MAMRAALMRAHVSAALALADDGQAQDAGAQFRLPIRAIYEPDLKVFEARRETLDTAKFELAALRAELGVSRAELRPLAEDLERQIARFAPRDYDRPRVIGALLTHLAAEYARGVEGQTVINPQRYQSAYGLALETLGIVTQAVRNGEISGETTRNQLTRETEALVYLCPRAAAPSRPSAPGGAPRRITRGKPALPAPR